MREGLVTKVRRSVEALKRVYYPVVSEKTEYIVVTKGVVVLPEPLIVRGLPTLRLKIIVR